MNLSTANIKFQAARLFVFLQTYGLGIVIVILCVLFGITALQRHFDRQEFLEQKQRDLKYEKAMQEKEKEREELLKLFNKQHSSTVEILESLKVMNASIGKIIENDRRQDVAVNNLKNEYSNARNQTKPDKTTAAARARRRNLPVRQREDDVLANDQELYGNDN